MFDGVPDQFHQFITPRTSSLPLHLPFPLSSTPNNTTFPTFDPYNQQNHPSHHHHHHHHQLPLQVQPNLLHPLHHQKDDQKQENTSVTTTPSMNFQIERDHTQILPQLVNPWTNDEILALLKIRSNMESWFPDFTWEHVSRKLAEVGYKRSADKCKEKFEEESRFFNNINSDNNNNNNNNYGKSYRFVTELEELYNNNNNNNNNNNQVVETEKPSEGKDKMDHDEDSRNHDLLVTNKKEESVTNEERKRKRGENRFEVFKGFCESVVKKMMEQQEEMHNKLIEDMLKRDEEKFEREEAWKKQEMEKMNKELELMAREQAIAGDRQANIIEFLNKFSTTKVTTLLNSSTILHSQNPNIPSSIEIHDKTIQPTPSSENPSSNLPSKKNPNISSLDSVPLVKNSRSSYNSLIMNEKEDIGRRWPKDEVLALINLRCNNNNNNNNEEKEGNKAPLWERISQGMLELGYKRSAKRCKEKWENINKYFRKTKDANRKRSLDSRTCPYFHLLSNLYNQGKLVLQSEKQESNLNVQENIQEQGEVAPADENKGGESSQVGPACW